MKRVTVILLLALVLLMTGCTAVSEEGSFIPYDREGNYIGFSDVPKKIYTAEEAEAAGCFVNDKTAVDRGRDVWEGFLQDAASGKRAKIRIVQIFEDGTFVKDLYFDGEAYYCFYYEEPGLVSRRDHLLVLTGKWESWQEENSVAILTNDPELTYRDFFWSMISSNSSDWVDAVLLFFD